MYSNCLICLPESDSDSSGESDIDFSDIRGGALSSSSSDEDGDVDDVEDGEKVAIFVTSRFSIRPCIYHLFCGSMCISFPNPHEQNESNLSNLY